MLGYYLLNLSDNYWGTEERPMSEPVKSDETTNSFPWIAVGVFFVDLFFALILQSFDFQQNFPAIPAGSPFWTIASLIMVAISLGGLVVASISWLTRHQNDD